MAEDKIKNALSVIKFNTYQTPKFVEQRGKQWVKFGEHNDYPDYIIKLFQRSPKHNAIITGKVDYIVGKGWEGSTPEAQRFVDMPNQEENLTDLSSKVALDIEMHSGLYLNIRTTPDGSKIVDHLPFNKMRASEDLKWFFYSDAWVMPNGTMNCKPDDVEKYNYKVFPAYDPNEPQPSSVFYYKGYSPNTSIIDAYPIPEYSGCIPYIEIDYEIANFHNNNIKTGIWGNVLFNFYNGIPTTEEQAIMEKQIEKKFAGTSGKRFMLNFSNGKDFGAEILPLNSNDTDKLFDQLNKTVQQEIFTGHKVTSPMLFGIKTEGQLGGRTELVEAYELFKETYIANRQKTLEDIFNFIFSNSRYARTLKLIEKPPMLPELSVTELQALTQAGIVSKLDMQEILRSKFNLKITAQPTETVVQPIQKQFAKEDESRIISRFAQMGSSADDYDVLKVRRIWFESDKDTILQAKEGENKLFAQCFATPTSGKVADLEAAILKILDKTPDLGYDAIAKQLKISVDRVKSVLSDLADAGYIEKTGKNIAITPAGEEILPPVTAETTEISIKYRYELNPAYPGPAVIPTTRPFCKEIIGFNKLYTRQEIEQIANEEDYNVFLYRGGWYTKPGTNDTTPYCRHQWSQVVVKKKRS